MKWRKLIFVIFFIKNKNKTWNFVQEYKNIYKLKSTRWIFIALNAGISRWASMHVTINSCVISRGCCSKSFMIHHETFLAWNKSFIISENWDKSWCMVLWMLLLPNLDISCGLCSLPRDQSRDVTPHLGVSIS